MLATFEKEVNFPENHPGQAMHMVMLYDTNVIKSLKIFFGEIFIGEFFLGKFFMKSRSVA
jgi:hypothetical protein